MSWRELDGAPVLGTNDIRSGTLREVWSRRSQLLTSGGPRIVPCHEAYVADFYG